MAIHWQVKFRSLRSGTVYTANVYDSSYSGSPIELTGADQPFTTEEDQSEDPFTPIRTQSGYLRIVDTGYDKAGNPFNWRDIIPATDTDRPVTLTHVENGVTVTDWQGFMQPLNFGVNMYGNPQVLEFPLECSISVTEAISINYLNTAIHNFAYLLKRITESIPSECAPQTFYIQGGQTAKDFLFKKIDWRNFVSSNDNEARMSMFECLEAMCKFWGWTLRSKNANWFFSCPDDADLTGLFLVTQEDLTYLQNGVDAGTIVNNYYNVGYFGNIFANEENTDSQMRGPYKVEISSDANIADDFVIAPFDSDLNDAMEEAGWRYGISYNGTIIAQTNDVLTVNRKDFIFYTRSGYASFNKVKKYQGAETGYGSSINVLEIKKSGSNSNPTMAYFETKYMHSFAQGFFVLHGTTYRGADEYIDTEGQRYSGNREMFMALGIGNTRATAKWWNGREWSSTYSRFTVTIGNRKPDYFTRYWSGSASAVDTNILVTGNLYGYLYADFFGSYAGVYGDRSIPDINGEKSFNLKDFSVEFFKNNVTIRQQYPNSGWNEITSKKSQATAHYKEHNNNRTRDNYSENNVFASENNMKAGYGVVLNTDGSYFSTYAYTSGTVRPEQHKVHRIVSYWAESKRKIETNLLATGTITVNNSMYTASDISPQFKLIVEGTLMWPVSIIRDWCDDVLKIKMVEI